MSMQGANEIPQNLRRLEKKFEGDAWQFPKKISDAWVFQIHIVDAIDKGNYLRSVGWREDGAEDNFQQTIGEAGSFQQFIVDTARDPIVTYPGFVEGGTKYMAARFPAQRGIEDVDFAQTFDAFVDYGLSPHSR